MNTLIFMNWLNKIFERLCNSCRSITVNSVENTVAHMESLTNFLPSNCCRFANFLRFLRELSIATSLIHISTSI